MIPSLTCCAACIKSKIAAVIKKNSPTTNDGRTSNLSTGEVQAFQGKSLHDGCQALSTVSMISFSYHELAFWELENQRIGLKTQQTK